MPSEKDRYTEIAAIWLQSYLRKRYAKTHKVQVMIPRSKLSYLSSDLRNVRNYPLLDFKPDVLGILTAKRDSQTDLIFMNRSISAISVKEIGEMGIYGIVANPALEFLVSPKGLSNEVNELLLNKNIETSLLGYGEEKFVIVFKLDKNGQIDKETVFPRNFKEIL